MHGDRSASSPTTKPATSADVFLNARPRARVRGWLRHAEVLAIVALGGAVGSGCRYLVGVALPHQPDAFPWATLLVNVVGCFLLGALMTLVTEVWRPGRYVRPFVGVGVLGGFTTFSTVAAQTRALGAHGAWLLANSYVVDTLLAGLVAVWLGVILTRLVTRRPVRRGGPARTRGGSR